MLNINLNQWGHNAQTLREQALIGKHPRTRERFLALYEITQGKNATEVSREIGRAAETVMSWVHSYNQRGLNALIYQKSGGRRPLFCPRKWEITLP